MKVCRRLHRYFALRQRMLNLPDLHYYDIYPPLVRNDRHFALADMRTTTLEAVRPLGPEYGRLLAGGTAARWMDPFPRQGKASGAYMSGSAYDVHPYLLLNLAEDYEGLTTYAHEWGHAIHTLLAKSRQPFETSDYATFTAEIASTMNEQLLARHMRTNARTREEKLFYLGQQMEQFRGTFYRQTMFAEFELRIHDMAEAGEGLSGERFTALYLELLRKYHGAGMEIDPLYAIEWAYIPHFYRTFYVFQYATSDLRRGLLRAKRAERRRGGAGTLSRCAARGRIGLSHRNPEARRSRYDHAGAIPGADRRVRAGAGRGGSTAGAGVALRSSPGRGGGPCVAWWRGLRATRRTPSVSAPRCHLPVPGRIA